MYKIKKKIAFNYASTKLGSCNVFFFSVNDWILLSSSPSENSIINKDYHNRKTQTNSSKEYLCKFKCDKKWTM